MLLFRERACEGSSCGGVSRYSDAAGFVVRVLQKLVLCMVLIPTYVSTY